MSNLNGRLTMIEKHVRAIPKPVELPDAPTLDELRELWRYVRAMFTDFGGTEGDALCELTRVLSGAYSYGNKPREYHPLYVLSEAARDAVEQVGAINPTVHLNWSRLTEADIALLEAITKETT